MSIDRINEFQGLRIEKAEKDSLWLLIITHPPANALTPKLVSELKNAFHIFCNDRIARALILTAEGERFFCSGADIHSISAISSPDEGAALAREGQTLCDMVEQSDKPIIAAINGFCIGGGNELSMACHMRIASEKAKFAQPEINLGIIPGFGGTQRLPRLIGPSNARRLMLTGDIVTSQEALALGLIDVVVKPDKLLDSAILLAKKILRNSQVNIEAIQKSIREGLDEKASHGMKLEIECFKKVCGSSDMKEGLLAYKEKRQPNYKHQ